MGQKNHLSLYKNDLSQFPDRSEYELSSFLFFENSDLNYKSLMTICNVANNGNSFVCERMK